MTRLVEPEDDELDGELYYHVVYTHTGAEDCTREQLLPLLRAGRTARLRIHCGMDSPESEFGARVRVCFV